MRLERMEDGEIRAVQLRLLGEIDRFCKARGIRYFLHAGTLLGAIRHEGFIPWDDDIDLAMFRSDFERFCQEFSSDDAGPCGIGAPGISPGYAYPWAKVWDTSTALPDPGGLAPGMGVNVDIFPLDRWPDRPLARVWYRARLRPLLYVTAVATRSRPPTRARWKALLVRLSESFVLRYVPPAGVALIITRAASRWEQHDTNEVGVTVFPKMQRVSASAYAGQPETRTFENRDYPVPADADEVLRNHYGNYMKLPPEAERHRRQHTDGAVWRRPPIT